MARQSASIKTICPKAGAIAGTKINTAMITDIICAIVRPPCRSLINAVIAVRGPATPMPWMNLPASMTSNRIEKTLIRHPEIKIRMPAKITGFLPKQSDKGPNNNCPIPN